MKEIIKVDSLTKKFRNLTAVDGLSFRVEEGDVYGFLGQNGAGKSTTIRMLLTLIKPSGGSIEIFGSDLHSNRKKILSQVGAIIEKPDVYQYLTAFQNLKIYARMSGLKPSTSNILYHLEMVGLKDRAYDRVKEFSQGMKQRLGIAVALIHDPALIILDEPTNGLDPQGIADVRKLILRLSRDLKKTVVVSSHLLNEIQQIATRLLIIDKGKCLVEGTTQELFDPLQTILELETENNQFALNQIKMSFWATTLQPQRSDSILLKIDRGKIPDFNSWMVQEGIRLVSLQTRHSLEDYFLQLTSDKQHVDSFAN